MNKIHRYKTKQGLSVIFIKKKGFVKSFCGIGCKYGGANIRFKTENKEVVSPYGIAHFIEHKLFAMPDGSDAFMTFTKQNAISNAYTAADKTVYYFTKNAEPWDSLRLLITMYFIPVFRKEDIEVEKQIILSELHMYEDNTGYTLMQSGMEWLYPQDDYSYPILGDAESILKTTAEDLYTAYEAFYTPKNSVLCIVGDLEPDRVFSFVEEVMQDIPVTEKQVEKLPTIYSSEVEKPSVIYGKFSQEEVTILLRMDKVSNADPTSCEKLLGILESVLSVSSSFYQTLEEEGLLTNELDYQVVTYLESSYIMISGPTKKPKLLAERIMEKLKSLGSEELDNRLVELYFRHLKAKSILNQDSIESLGDTVLSLALEDIDYSAFMEDILKLKPEDLKTMLCHIRQAEMTYIISKKKENKKDEKSTK